MSDTSRNDASQKYDIAKEMFDHACEVNEHEDAKAGKIVEAMAFLSITAVTAFAVFVTVKLSVKFTFLNTNFDLVSISFAGFSVFVALGIFIFLEASLGGIERQKRRLENETKSEAKDGKKKIFPHSFFYFKDISEEALDQWNSYFNSDINVNDLMSKAYRDHVKETFFVSQKTRMKVKYYKFGKLCFYLAIVFFVILVLAGCSAI